MKKTHLLVPFLLGLVLFSGCTSQKKLAYFNHLNENAADSINQKSIFRHEATIKFGDMLVITVSGSDPKTIAVFNLPIVSYSSPMSEQVYGVQALQPYVVDKDGCINFPVLGRLKVEGLTRIELVDLLTEKIKTYVQDPIVNLKFMNFNVTILGEVNRPGQYQVSNERTTVLDAIGLAGDLTAYGKRNDILISREVNGKLEFKRLNLNDASIFNSPYYYVQQNDVIYVEPNSVKSVSSQNVPLYLSSISTLATIVTLIFSIYQANKK